MATIGKTDISNEYGKYYFGSTSYRIAAAAADSSKYMGTITAITSYLNDYAFGYYGSLGLVIVSSLGSVVMKNNLEVERFAALEDRLRKEP